MTDNPQHFFLPPALVQQALEDFLAEVHRGLDVLEAIPVRQRSDDDRLALKLARRDAAAYARALDYWEEELYPSCLDGIWSIDSLSERGQVKHHIWHEYDTTAGRWHWRCDCKQANGGFHVHQAIMIGIERALDLADAYDVPAPASLDDLANEALAQAEPPAETEHDDPFLPDAPRELGRRLALARSAVAELYA